MLFFDVETDLVKRERGPANPPGDSVLYVKECRDDFWRACLCGARPVGYAAATDGDGARRPECLPRGAAWASISTSSMIPKMATAPGLFERTSELNAS